MKWFDFVEKQDPEGMKAYHTSRNSERNNAPETYDFRFRDRANNLKHVQAQVGMIPGTSKRVTSLIDITQRKTAEEKLQKALTELESIFENSQVGIMLLKGGRILPKATKGLQISWDTKILKK